MSTPLWLNQRSLVLASNNKGKIAEFEKMLKDLPNAHAELIVQYQKEKEEKLKSQKVLDFIQERAHENKVLFKISSDENISINNSRKR